MRILGRAFLAVAVIANSVLPSAAMAADQQYFFRYKAAMTNGDVDPGQPQEADITARFVGVVGFPFSEKMPLVAGKTFSSWKVTSGTLPDGLTFDSATGTISGQPTVAGKGYVIDADGYGANGTPAGSAQIEIDVFKAADGYRPVDFYAHTNHYELEQLDIPAGVTVDHWNVIYSPPPGVQILGRNYDGTPTKAGRYPVAVQGFDYLDREVILLTGYYLVEDGPTFPQIADDVRPVPNTPGSAIFNDWPPYVRSVTPAQSPNIRYSVEVKQGDVLPGTLQSVPTTGLLSGSVSIPYQTATVRWKAVDTDGTVGYSNWWKIGTSNPQPDFLAATLGPFNMIVGNHYEIPFSTIGTPGTKNFSLLSGTLPEGLTLDSINGVIKGTPVKDETQTGIRLHLAVTNNGNVDEKDSVPFTIKVDKAEVGLRVASQTKSNVRTGEPFSATLEKWGDIVQPATVAIDPATPLPAGVSFDPASLTVSGTVSVAGQQLWHFVLNNGDGRSRDASVRLGVYAPLSLVNGGALAGADGLVDAEGNISIQQYGSYSPIASVSAVPNSVMPVQQASAAAAGVPSVVPEYSVIGSMPEGVRIDPITGIISGGTTAAMGTYGPFAAQVADGSGNTALGSPFYIKVTERQALKLVAQDVTFHSGLEETISPVALVQRPPLSTFMNLTWTLTGTLPDGLSFDRNTGKISGTPTNIAVYPDFILSVQDEDGAPYAAASAPFSVHVEEAVPIVAKTMADVRSTVGYPLSIPSPVFLNTIGSVTYAAKDELPAGLSLDPTTGAITGSPTETFSEKIVIVATDGQRRSGEASVQTTILPNPTVETADGASLQIARLETKTFSVKPTNVVGVPAFALVSGTFPAGLSFSSATGAISGTATKEGASSPIVIGMTDTATGATAKTDPFTITVGPRKDLEIAYNNPTVYDDQPYVNLPIMPSVHNAAGAVNFTVNGVVPVGLTFDGTNGFFRGLPTTPGLYPLTVAAIDSDGSQATAGISIKVSRYSGLTGPGAVDGGKWRVSQQITTPSLAYTNGIGTIVYASPSVLPGGASLDPSTGSIVGSVTAAGSYKADVNAKDSDERTKWGPDTVVSYQVFDHLAIASAPSSISTTQYPAAGLSLPTTVSNAIGPIGYMLSGTLPQGVTFDTSTGLISGKPQAKGTFQNLVVTATDPHDNETVSTSPFSITVLDRVPLKATLPTIATTLANRDVLKIAQPTVTGAANGGSVSYSYSGTLPAGVSFDAATGTFHGVATVLGDFPGITVTVTDEKAATSVAGPMTIRSVLDGNPITLDVGDIVTKVGYPFTTGVPTTANTIGEQHFYSYDIVPQINLNTKTGEMTGAFTSVQDFNFDLYVGDETSRATSERIKVQVLPALRVVVPTVVSSRQAEALAQAVDTFYKAGTVVYSKGAGTWPAGVSVDPSTGSLTGTLTADVGDYAGLTIKGVDSFGAGNTDTQFSNVFTIKVQPIAASPVISDIAGAKMVFGTVGKAATPFTPTVVDSKLGKPWTYSGTVYSLNRALPAGLSFDTTTGRISGTPTEAAIIPDLVITVTSQAGAVDSTAPFSFEVKPITSTLRLTVYGSTAPHVCMGYIQLFNADGVDVFPQAVLVSSSFGYGTDPENLKDPSLVQGGNGKDGGLLCWNSVNDARLDITVPGTMSSGVIKLYQRKDVWGESAVFTDVGLSRKNDDGTLSPLVRRPIPNAHSGQIETIPF